MKVTKSIQNTGADPEGLPPLPPIGEKEKEENMILKRDRLLIRWIQLSFIFFIFNNFWIRWGPRRSLDPSPTQGAPFKFLVAHLK